jgi:multicomponent Na+:H+ antiporter subunit G
MTVLEIVSAALVVTGAFFFLAGTAGILRFPDLHSRIHALTKADNLGLGFVVLGLIVQSGSVAVILKLILVWILALLAAGTNGYLDDVEPDSIMDALQTMAASIFEIAPASADSETQP